jgi:hypothetical protein
VAALNQAYLRKSLGAVDVVDKVDPVEEVDKASVRDIFF